VSHNTGLWRRLISPERACISLAALKTSANSQWSSQWSSQLAELDGAVEALKTTIAGITSDSLVSELPTILSDLHAAAEVIQIFEDPWD
jgi:hypothetical protein